MGSQYYLPKPPPPSSLLHMPSPSLQDVQPIPTATLPSSSAQEPTHKSPTPIQPQYSVPYPYPFTKQHARLRVQQFNIGTPPDMEDDAARRRLNLVTHRDIPALPKVEAIFGVTLRPVVKPPPAQTKSSKSASKALPLARQEEETPMDSRFSSLFEGPNAFQSIPKLAPHPPPPLATTNPSRGAPKAPSQSSGGGLLLQPTRRILWRNKCLRRNKNHPSARRGRHLNQEGRGRALPPLLWSSSLRWSQMLPGTVSHPRAHPRARQGRRQRLLDGME